MARARRLVAGATGVDGVPQTEDRDRDGHGEATGAASDGDVVTVVERLCRGMPVGRAERTDDGCDARAGDLLRPVASHRAEGRREVLRSGMPVGDRRARPDGAEDGEPDRRADLPGTR